VCGSAAQPDRCGLLSAQAALCVAQLAALAFGDAKLMERCSGVEDHTAEDAQWGQQGELLRPF
jgi:hypothetical protein